MIHILLPLLFWQEPLWYIEITQFGILLNFTDALKPLYGIRHIIGEL